MILSRASGYVAVDLRIGARRRGMWLGRSSALRLGDSEIEGIWGVCEAFAAESVAVRWK